MQFIAQKYNFLGNNLQQEDKNGLKISSFANICYGVAIKIY